MNIDLTSFEKLRQQKYLKRGDHPTLPLYIYAYTDICQWERYWTPQTILARGLVVDHSGVICSRPFSKFWNYGEPDAPTPPDLPFEVYEKLDGSLVSISKYQGNMVVASKSSFTSWHKERAEKIINEKYPGLPQCIEEDKTYVFELIDPENLIVISYGDTSDLYQLAVIDNETGKDLPMEHFGPPHVQRHDGYSSIDNLPERKGHEGFVIRFEDDTRLKIKHEDYVNLHSIVFQTNEKSIWRMLKEGNSKEEVEDSLLASLPDERHQWAKDTLKALTTDFEATRGKVISEYSRIQEELGDSDRKAYAEEIKKRDDIKHLLFMHMSGKDFTGAIWRDLEPKLS